MKRTQRNKATRTTLVLILLGLLIGLVDSAEYFLKQAKSYYFKKTHEKDMRNLETEVITIELSGQSFDIPLRYMYSEAMEKYHQWPSAKKERVKVDALSLSVLLPDLRPYHPEDDLRWKVKGHGDRLEVTIMKPVGNAEWFELIKNRYLSGSEPGNVKKESDEYGLLHYSDLGDWYFPTTGSKELVITCDKLGSVPSPSCEVKSNYRPGIVLEYYYGRGYLPNWQVIDDRLKFMFDNFLIN